jgi:hypothetical protein
MYEYANTQRCEKVFQRYDLNMQHSFDEDAEAVPISTIWIESLIKADVNPALHGPVTIK